VPSGLIEDQHGMSAGVDSLAYFEQMRFHCRGVAIWHDKSRTLASGGADRAEYIRPFCALVVSGAGPGAAFGPPSGDLVFLADARLILEPQFYAGSGREPLADLRQFGGKSFGHV
jgi:hypothetical protein